MKSFAPDGTKVKRQTACQPRTESVTCALKCCVLEEGEDKQGPLFPVLALTPAHLLEFVPRWHLVQEVVTFTLVHMRVCHPSGPEVVESMPALLVPVDHASPL